ncbi:MAG TPA: hypothetical protein VFO16_07355 [Pseudonocardiaceae bacterium]|nr:hypothetical protein [Pseudonocardiaceae bacterium]
MTDPSDAPAEPDFYATADHWLSRGTESVDHPDQAHHCLLAGVGYALLAAVQMDCKHSSALNRRMIESPPSARATTHSGAGRGPGGQTP